MPRFQYRALDSSGRKISGVSEAAADDQVIAALRRQGLFPVAVQPVGGSRPEGQPAPRVALRFGWGSARVGRRDAAVFLRQLATLLAAGLPLLKALETLARQERNRTLRVVITRLADDIRSGRMLSDAMRQHTRLFDELDLSMVRAGEAGGVLDVVLARMAGFAEKSLQLRARIRAAMTYPLVVLVVAVSVLTGLLVFVVPRFRQIFADLLKGAPLPPLTQGVLDVSAAVQTHYLQLIAGAGLLWVGLMVIRRTAAGARQLDRLWLWMPVTGRLLLLALVARFSRTLGTLLASGVPMLPALLIARDTCGNRHVAAAVQVVHDRVREGDSVARPLGDTAVFPPMVASMIDVGEHTGRLADMLGKVADIYDAEVDHAVAGLSSLIEPVLIVFLALVVGTIVIALFLPIVRIVQLLS